MRKPGQIMIAIAACVALAACSPPDEPSDQPPGAGDVPTPGAELTPPGEETPAGDECTAEDFTVEGETDAAPEITVPDDCAPPSQLIAEDLVEGDGAAVEAGSGVVANYVLYGLSTGEQIESSWRPGGDSDPLTVPDIGGLIDGWSQGLLGMREDGRRLLVVPSELGYGGQPGHELADETLVFVIDLISVT